MKIGFVINDFETEGAGYTTTRISQAAREMGHESWTIPWGTSRRIRTITSGRTLV